MREKKSAKETRTCGVLTAVTAIPAPPVIARRLYNVRFARDLNDFKKTLRLAPIEREGRKGVQREGRAE